MRIGIIGYGNMGKALYARLHSLYSIYVYDHHPEKYSKEKTPPQACSSLQELCSKTDILFLCIKPHQLESLGENLKRYLTKQHLLISILAKVGLQQLELLFPSTPCALLMPSLPLIHGMSALAASIPDNFPVSYKEQIKEICSSLGDLYWIKEEQMLAFASAASCSIGFALLLIEGFIEGNMHLGFNQEQARSLAIKAVQGALSLVDNSEEHPSSLKWKVCSPKGMTLKGLEVLERKAVKAALIEALKKAIEIEK